MPDPSPRRLLTADDSGPWAPLDWPEAREVPPPSSRITLPSWQFPAETHRDEPRTSER